MNNGGKAWLIAFVIAILIPGLIFSVSEKIISREPVELPTETTPPTQSAAKEPITQGLSVQTNNGMVIVSMQTYLTGVLLAEMPVDFEFDALKAQAVAARTYAYRRSLDAIKHSNGAVCTDAACCQAYRSIEEFLNSGGTQAQLEKVSLAVQETEGEVLIYDGRLIDATYFSCSGGRTEDALAVWGTDVPYLQAVDSPGEEAAAHYTDSLQFSAQEFAERLGISPTTSPTEWLGRVTYTDGGGVATMEICGKFFRGTELRQKLGLRSTAMSILTIGDNFHILTRGYGHRVGLSQYGAEAMALRGSNYREILAHYYPGTELSLYSQN